MLVQSPYSEKVSAIYIYYQTTTLNYYPILRYDQFKMKKYLKSFLGMKIPMINFLQDIVNWKTTMTM